MTRRTAQRTRQKVGDEANCQHEMLHKRSLRRRTRFDKGFQATEHQNTVVETRRGDPEQETSSIYGISNRGTSFGGDPGTDHSEFSSWICWFTAHSSRLHGIAKN